MLRLTLDASSVSRAIALFERFPRDLSSGLRRAMVNSTVDVMFRLKSTVHVITGTLRRSWQPKPILDSGDGVGWAGGTGTTLAYAAAEEFGLVGTQSVRAHVRHVASRDVRSKVERSGEEIASGRFKSRHKRVLTAKGIAYVRAHQRRVNRPAHPYARPALADSREAVVRFHELAIAATYARLARAAELA